MSNIDDILKLANDYHDNCLGLIKDARIRKMPSGKYRVVSEKGKNLGESTSKGGAKKRLKEVEYFKHRDQNSIKDEKEIDLTDIDDFGYSAVMRKLRQKCDKEQVKTFLKLYKKYFDNAVKDKVQKPEKIALQTTLIKFNKICKVKLPKKLVKNAAVTELGDPIQVGQYLANIVKFTLNRISPEGRPAAIEKLKTKFKNINIMDIANKDLPASSAIGQSIVFVKYILFNHDPEYIKDVLNSLIGNI